MRRYFETSSWAVASPPSRSETNQNFAVTITCQQCFLGELIRCYYRYDNLHHFLLLSWWSFTLCPSSSFAAMFLPSDPRSSDSKSDSDFDFRFPGLRVFRTLPSLMRKVLARIKIQSISASSKSMIGSGQFWFSNWCLLKGTGQHFHLSICFVLFEFEKYWVSDGKIKVSILILLRCVV